MTKEEIQQLNEPQLIELLENTTESWQKAEIISCLTDDEKKKELMQNDNIELKKIEEELREKYNIDNLFKKKNNQLDVEEKQLIVDIQKKWYQKVWEFVNKLFKRKNI